MAWNKITNHRRLLKGLDNTKLTYGSMYDTGSAAGTTIAASEWLKLSGATLVNPAMSSVTMSANNRLTYTGSQNTEICQLSAQANIVSTVDDLLVDLAFAKNGSVLSQSIGRKFLTGSAAGSGSQVVCGGIVSLAKNDYVELWARPSKAATLTGSYMTVSLARIQ